MPASVQIEGVRPVIEAIRAGRRRVLEVLTHPEPRTPGAIELDRLLREREIPHRPLPPGDRRGVRARAEPYPECSFEELLTGPAPVFLAALDRVTDVGNLGSIARSADTAGVNGLVLEHRRVPPIGPGALRASAGALEHLRVGRTPNLRRALELAVGEGVAVLAADASGPPIADVPPALLRGGLIWVFGSEDRGLRPALRAAATALVGIPLAGGVGSLGVAAAAAYLLHRTAELRREPEGWRGAAK